MSRPRQQGTRPPHHKYGQLHRPDCNCHYCRRVRREVNAAKVLERLAQAEEEGVQTSQESEGLDPL